LGGEEIQAVPGEGERRGRKTGEAGREERRDERSGGKRREERTEEGEGRREGKGGEGRGG